MKNKILKYQGERLAFHLGLKPGVFFEMSDLSIISAAEIGDIVTVFDKPVTVTSVSKSLAKLLFVKLSR